MQTISTKVLSATNNKPMRIIARTSGSGTKFVVSVDAHPTIEDAHKEAAMQLFRVMRWHGSMTGGNTEDGMMWVFVGGACPTFTIE